MIRIGIAGCGKIAYTKHLPELIAIEDAEIKALFDWRRENAELMAKQFNLDAKIYNSYEEMLADPCVDCVYVLTPNAIHKEYSILALRAGKSVMCEKPMAMNASEAEEIVKTMQETGRHYSISCQNRFRSDVLELKKLVDNGELGEIYFARAVAIRRRGVPTWGSFLSMDRQGGGPLIDIGIHSLDLALWLMDNYEVNYVSGVSFHKLGQNHGEPNKFGPWENNKFEVEDSAFGFVVMKNGAVIVVESSWAINRNFEKEACVELSGTLGGADLYDGLTLNGVQNGRLYTKKYLDFESNTSRYLGAKLEAESWINSLQGVGDHCVKAEQVAVATRIIEAIYTSSQTGKPIYF